MRRRRPPSLATLALTIAAALALVPAGAGDAAARPAGPVVSRVTAIALPE